MQRIIAIFFSHIRNEFPIRIEIIQVKHLRHVCPHNFDLLLEPQTYGGRVYLAHELSLIKKKQCQIWFTYFFRPLPDDTAKVRYMVSGGAGWYSELLTKLCRSPRPSLGGGWDTRVYSMRQMSLNKLNEK